MRAIDWLAPIRNRVPSIYRPRPRRRKKLWQPIAAQVERMEDRTLLSSAPIFDAPSYSFSIGDDATSGQAVGTVSATDPDPGDMVMYGITAGDPGGVFSIDSMTGQISVMDDTSLNGGQTYVLTVEASDGLLSDSVSVTIDVVETNLPPVFDEPSYTFPLGDDASSGTVVGTVSATDPNPSDFLSYYITAGDPESIFTIDFMTGQISVMDPTTLDGGDTFVLSVEVSDGEATDSVSVTINVTETNLPPTFDEPSYAFEIAEDANMGDPVGTVTASDPNPSDMLMYNITDGNTGSAFTIDSMTGAITVMNDFVLSAGQEYTLTVEVSDGEATDSASVTINVLAGTPAPNTPPTAGDDGPFSLVHDSTHTQSTAEILSNDFDMDPGDTLTAIIDSLPENGELKRPDLTPLAVGDTFDDTFIYKPNFGFVGEDSFTYYVTDGLANSSPATVTFQITNNAPQLDAEQIGEFDFDDNGVDPVTGIVGTVHAVDLDGDSITYQIEPNPYFTINPNTGEITLVDAEQLWLAYSAGYPNDLEFDVQAVDSVGALSVGGKFRILGALAGPPYVRIETQAGQIYRPTTAAGFVAALNEIEDNDDTITLLIAKGHGGYDGVQIDQAGNWFLFVPGGDRPDTIEIGGTDVTETLTNITGLGTRIDLRGCFTRQAANNMENLLNNGTDVRGAVRYTISLPGTPIAIGIYD